MQWLKRLDTQLNEPINQNSIKVPKVVKPTNKKTLLYKTLGIIVINSLFVALSPSLPLNIGKNGRIYNIFYNKKKLNIKWICKQEWVI